MSRSIPLLVKVLTGNKLKWRSSLWKGIIDPAIKVVHLSAEAKGPFPLRGPTFRKTINSVCRYIMEQESPNIFSMLSKTNMDKATRDHLLKVKKQQAAENNWNANFPAKSSHSIVELSFHVHLPAV